MRENQIKGLGRYASTEACNQDNYCSAPTARKLTTIAMVEERLRINVELTLSIETRLTMLCSRITGNSMPEGKDNVESNTLLDVLDNHNIVAHNSLSRIESMMNLLEEYLLY